LRNKASVPILRTYDTWALKEAVSAALP
jgi:hypothetical protein